MVNKLLPCLSQRVPPIKGAGIIAHTLCSSCVPLHYMLSHSFMRTVWKRVSI